MKELTRPQTERVTGAMNLNGLRESNNTVNIAGKNRGSWIDAANVCWRPGTPSLIMYPGGFYIPAFRF